MRISRPCYDKMHRCPGWAGGGWFYAKVDRCTYSGSLGYEIYDGRLWRWRFNRCKQCGLLVWPYMVRWLEWRSWTWWARTAIGWRVRDWWWDRRRR